MSKRIPFVFDERSYSTLEELTQSEPELGEKSPLLQLGGCNHQPKPDFEVTLPDGKVVTVPPVRTRCKRCGRLV